MTTLRTLDPVHARRAAQSAFTMVEIALSLAVIGFALVAILRVLPIGLNTQRDNREETAVNHDAALWMDALRAGPRGISLDEELTNYVGVVTKTVVDFNVDPNNGNLTVRTVHPDLAYSNLFWPQIIGLLSTPRYERPDATTLVSNYVSADVRAMTGPAVTRVPQNNEVINDAAFTYRLFATVDDPPLAPAPGGDPAAAQARQQLDDHLRDVRLSFRWPVLPNGETGRGRRTYRASFGGVLKSVPSPDVNKEPDLWFFQPHTY